MGKDKVVRNRKEVVKSKEEVSGLMILELSLKLGLYAVRLVLSLTFQSVTLRSSLGMKELLVCCLGSKTWRLCYITVSVKKGERWSLLLVSLLMWLDHGGLV